MPSETAAPFSPRSEQAVRLIASMSERLVTAYRGFLIAKGVSRRLMLKEGNLEQAVAAAETLATAAAGPVSAKRRSNDLCQSIWTK